MKSNQLNAIALLLLATAGLSAVKYNDVQKAYDVVRGEKITVDEAQKLALPGKFANYVAAMNSANDKTNYRNAILIIADQNATFVQKNKERVKRNIIDPVMRNKRTILKATTALLAAGATAYAIDRYGFESKGLQYTKESTAKGVKATKEMASNVYAKGQGYGSWLYSKLPSKPTWLAMPAFVSNLFPKKTVEPKAETVTEQTNQIAKTITDAVTDTIDKTSKVVKNAVNTTKEKVDKIAKTKTRHKIDTSAPEMVF